MTMPRAVLFDLLTALLDSWSVWNAAAIDGMIVLPAPIPSTSNAPAR